MITFDALTRQIDGLYPPDLRHWIALSWVRPEGAPGAWLFHDMDVARVRLIVTLRGDLHIDENALPTVLSLLDQLYDARRTLLRLAEALDAEPPDVRQRVLDTLPIPPGSGAAS